MYFSTKLLKHQQSAYFFLGKMVANETMLFAQNIFI